MTLMRKIFLTALLAAIISTVTLYSRENNGKSFLWKIETEAGTSYLLGSIHLLKKDVYPLKAVIENAFELTDVLAVEADISSDKMGEVGLQMLGKGMYQGEETLKDNISAETFQLAKKKLDELGMDIDGFNKFKPWMAALSITSMQLIKMGFNPEYGIDKYFLEKASGKKKIEELEGLEFQMKLFDSLSKEENEKFLLSSILEAEKVGKEVDNMVKAWLTGDTGEMEELMTGNIEKYPKLRPLYKKIIDDRNERMTAKIITYLKSEFRYFIVVGAGHMIGQNGIVQLLRDKGYTVEQL